MNPPRIGMLLPRSVDYPSMGFDMLDGLRLSLRRLGITDAKISTENIGLGEDAELNYARAEKLLIEDEADLIIAYCNMQNAELLYPLAASTGKPFIFLDAGMQFRAEDPNPFCIHLSLQGIHACRLLGRMAGENNRKVLMASSFFDAGFRGPQSSSRGLEESGGSVCANFVSAHKISEFSIASYQDMIEKNTPDSVMANFSIYLNELFIRALQAEGKNATALPFYCSPFMAEESSLSKCNFPGGTFHTLVPWASTLENEAQKIFLETIKKEKNKTATIFHLLGWEAGITAKHLLEKGVDSAAGWSFESPRGKVNFHPVTRISYAPLYNGKIVGDEDGKCALKIDGKTEITAEEHELIAGEKQEGIYSGWKNNYFCA
jgi:branched-chain amino acid transport system substrate-binding protein